MADEIKVPYVNPDGSVSNEAGACMDVTELKEPWPEYIVSDGTKDRTTQALIHIAKLEGRVAPSSDLVYREKVASLFSKAVGNLLKIRDHLLLQLDLECGNISEEYFDEEEPKCLTEAIKIPFERLKEEIDMLYNLTNLPLDSEDISEILNCTIDDAEKGLNNYLGKV